MSHLYRLDGGRPIRRAMKARRMSGPRLAAATREVDPAGKGLSAAAIGRIAGAGETAQNRTRIRSGWLIALALKEPVQRLFTPFSMPPHSTATVERATPDAGLHGASDAGGTAGGAEAEAAATEA